ncbi:MAG: sulfur carrier protein ThiS [Candidatus Margulisiibacteriota bacterium]
MIKVIVNGKPLEVKKETTIADLLSHYKISPKVCAVERNGEILERNEYLRIMVKEKDIIEIIRMMGGG